jgi:hypothetical protein
MKAKKSGKFGKLLLLKKSVPECFEMSSSLKIIAKETHDIYECVWALHRTAARGTAPLKTTCGQTETLIV